MLVSERKPSVAQPLPDQPKLTWKEIVQSVQPFLTKVSAGLSEQVEAFDPEIAAYARYALTNQGKQIRPALVALSGAAVGNINDSLLRAAVIIEMVHLATLVHDDVMDEAEMRRRRPTVAANWGNEISVLLGDCLFAHAVTLAASFPTPDVCRAVASATNIVCSGEILQTNQRGNLDLSRPEYFRAVAMKTGELFALSCELGAGLAGGTPAERNALRAYGMALGTAYQIYDDCLDLFGSEAAVGKSLGTDLLSRKITLPLLIIVENATASDRNLLTKRVEPNDRSEFSGIFELLERYNALNGARRVVLQYIKQAQHALSQLKHRQGVDALGALSEFLTQQTNALGVQS